MKSPTPMKRPNPIRMRNKRDNPTAVPWGYYLSKNLIINDIPQKNEGNRRENREKDLAHNIDNGFGCFFEGANVKNQGCHKSHYRYQKYCEKDDKL